MNMKRFEPITWAFFFANTVYALGFILTAYTPLQTKSSLYDALDGVWDYLPETWGALGLLAVGLSLAAARLDWKGLGSVSCLLGIGTWLYAVLIYLETHYYIVAFSVGALYLTFWVAFYFTHISKVTSQK